MKKIALLILIIAFPFAASAAPLTEPQAKSLIGVVRSAPETPASAFTHFIIAFSNITVQQAESLIRVIQATPTAPERPFVDMLLAFTVDPEPTPTPTPTPNPTPQPTTPNLGGFNNDIITNMSEITVSVQRQVFNAIEKPTDVPEYTSSLFPHGNYYFSVIVKGEDGKPIDGSKGDTEKVSVAFPANHDQDSPYAATESDGSPRVSLYPSINGATFGPYIPTSSGSHTVTFTFGDLTKEVTVEVE